MRNATGNAARNDTTPTCPRVSTACLEQRFVSQGAATFFPSVLPLDGEKEFLLFLASAGKKAE